MTEQTARICPECGAPLPAHAEAKLCPKCLLAAAIKTAPCSNPPKGATAHKSAPQTRGMPGPGDELGHYRILRVLGEGGMGAVFEAQDTETGRQVALKVLSHALDSPAARQRFFREGRLAASLNHPNSVYVFGTEEIGGTPVIAMELVGGGTLQERVCRLGPLPPSEAVDAVVQIISGLEAAQKLGILHRDIKPSNCFVGPGGVVKVGDFGLSISTSIRIEPSLTATGAFLGTPAFTSPEQLRGDELSFRADMYSVGATLFYLLTGRTPFEGKSQVQLLAAVLEQRAPSPRQFRPEVPRGLGRVVLRCLEKQPAERFKSYAELATALAPYGSSAPTPATLGLRLVAGMVDLGILSTVGTILTFSFSNPFDFLSQVAQGKPGAIIWMAGGALSSLLYYGLFEGLRGATPGKALFGLRVAASTHIPVSLGQAISRALIYVLLPVLPYWLIYMTALRTVASSFVFQQMLGVTFYVVLGLLFSTARRRNGFAAVHDLATGTRVVSRAAVQVRPELSPVPPAPSLEGATAKVGPYVVLEMLSSSPKEEWLVGYDLCLLRKVWIRKVAAGTPPVPAGLRNLGRSTRLRWLGGRRSEAENWDAFEALSGSPLPLLARKPQSWQLTRFWLHDLASELAAAQKDGTMPETLGLDRVWLTAEGRAKLLDFPAPGWEAHIAARTSGQAKGQGGACEMPTRDTARYQSAPPPLDAPPERYQLFLAEVAAAALNGRNSAVVRGEPLVKAPLPLHARELLNRLPLLSIEAIASCLKPLLNRVAFVSRARRGVVVAGCLVLPLFVAGSVILGLSVAAKPGSMSSELIGLNTVLQARLAANSALFRSKPHPTDKEFAVYIATHYRSIITNAATWSNPFAISMFRTGARDFAEKSVAENPAPSPEEQAKAEEAVKAYAPAPQYFDLKKQPWFPFFFFMGCLGVYVGIPALIAAVAFRGGLVLLAAGVVYVRKDGERASRLRLLWRGVVAWSVVPIAFILQVLLKPALGMLSSLLVALAVAAILTGISLALRERGLPERFSGTWPVPR